MVKNFFSPDQMTSSHKTNVGHALIMMWIKQNTDYYFQAILQAMGKKKNDAKVI